MNADKIKQTFSNPQIYVINNSTTIHELICIYALTSFVGPKNDEIETIYNNMKLKADSHGFLRVTQIKLLKLSEIEKIFNILFMKWCKDRSLYKINRKISF